MSVRKGMKKHTMMLLLILVPFIIVLFLNEVFNLDDRLRYLKRTSPKHTVIGVLWPSLGNPEIIPVQRDGPALVEAIISLDSMLEIGDIQGKLIPVGLIAERHEVILETLSVEKKPLNKIENRGRWGAWILQNTAMTYRVNFVVPQKYLTDNKLRTLCNLQCNVKGKIFEKANAVFLTSSSFDKLTVLYASDIHVASRWDDIEADVEKYFPAKKNVSSMVNTILPFDSADMLTNEMFKKSFLNPNRAFSKLIREANVLFDRGEIEFLVLAGDLVDYKFKHERSDSGNGYEDTEWSVFEDILMGRYRDSERLRVPVFMTTGNHDYRLYPYSLQVYGIRHCGIPDDFTMEYLRRYGNMRSITYHISDLDSIRIDSGIDNSLNYYYQKLNPFDDYSFKLGGVKHIFIDTGSDNVCHLSNLFSSRRWLFVKGLQNAVENPNSNGLQDDQLKFIESEIMCEDTATPVILYTHAPFINNRPDNELPGGPEESPLPLIIPLTAPSNNDSDNILKYEDGLVKSRLNISALFQNQFPVFSLLTKRRGQALIMSGHVHHRVEFGIDRDSGQLYSSGYSNSSNLGHILQKRLLFLQGPAIGHVERSYQEGSVPSYRFIKIKGKSIAAVQYKQLAMSPFDKHFATIHYKNIGESIRELAVRFSKMETYKDIGHGRILHRIVLIFSESTSPYLWQNNKKPRLEVSPGVRIADDSVNWDADNKMISLMVEDTNLVNLKITNFFANGKISLITETFTQRSNGYESEGAVWHHNILE